MNPTLTPPAAADPIDRLLAAFFSGRGPHTLDAYTRDLDDFTAFVRQHTLTTEKNPIGRAGRDTAALRWFFDQTPGQANDLVLHYKTDLLTRRKPSWRRAGSKNYLSAGTRTRHDRAFRIA